MPKTFKSKNIPTKIRVSLGHLGWKKKHGGGPRPFGHTPIWRWWAPRNDRKDVIKYSTGLNGLSKPLQIQGSLYYLPKQGTIWEIPQVYSTFALFDPSRIGNLMTPEIPRGKWSQNQNFTNLFMWIKSPGLENFPQNVWLPTSWVTKNGISQDLPTRLVHWPECRHPHHPRSPARDEARVPVMHEASDRNRHKPGGCWSAKRQIRSKSKLKKWTPWSCFLGSPHKKKSLAIFPHQICFSVPVYWCWWPRVQTTTATAPNPNSIRGGSTTQSLFRKHPWKSVQATAL